MNETTDKKKADKLLPARILLERFRSTQEILSVDFGHAQTRAAVVRKSGDAWILEGSVLLPSPLQQGLASAEALAEQLREIKLAFRRPIKHLVVSLPAGEIVLRVAEVPEAAARDLNTVLRFNSIKFLQQELKDHVFDHVLLSVEPPGQKKEDAETASGEIDFGDGKISIMRPAGAGVRHKLALVGAIPASLLESIQRAAASAGFTLDGVMCAQACLIDTALVGMERMLEMGTFGFLHIGENQTSLSLLVSNQIVFIRSTPTGTRGILKALAASLNITPQVAEGLVMTMPAKVREKLAKAVAPLVDDIRTSVDYFEERWERPIMRLFVSGGDTKSDILLELLNEGIGAPRCDRWNPVSCITKSDKAMHDAAASEGSKFGAAIGAAVGVLGQKGTSINLLSEHLEKERSRRRDPVRLIKIGTLMIVLSMALASGALYWKSREARADLNQLQEYSRSLSMVAHKVDDYMSSSRASTKKLSALHRQAADRFLWATALNSIQGCMVEDIQVMRMDLRQIVTHTPAVKAETDIDGTVVPGRPASSTARTVLSITAKDFGDPPARERFIDAIRQHAYFKTNLQPASPVRLVDLLPVYVDTFGDGRPYRPFTIECLFREKTAIDD